MSGRHMDSHMPYSDSGAVPASMKSCAFSTAPIESVPHRKACQAPSLPCSSPATTGEQKYGPNLHFPCSVRLSAELVLVCAEQLHACLFSYSVEDTSSPKVEGFMSRSSRSLYRLCLNAKRWNLQHTRSASCLQAHTGQQQRQGSQRRGIGAQPAEAQVEAVVDALHLLVVCGQRLELHAQPEVAGYGHALLAGHSHDGRAIVLEDLQPARICSSCFPQAVCTD